MQEKNSAAIFNGSLLCLFFILLGLFAIWIPWIECTPLSGFDASAYPGIVSPPNAECFSISHGSVKFLTLSGQWRITGIILALGVLIALPACIWLTHVSRTGLR